MSTEDYDRVEKLFGGTWKFIQTENKEEFMAAAGFPESTKELWRQEEPQKSLYIITREGNTITERVELARDVVVSTMELGKVLEWKDKEAYQSTMLMSFKDDVLTFDVTPQSNGGKRHIYKETVKGDELLVELTLPDGPSVVEKRIYKKC